MKTLTCFLLGLCLSLPIFAEEKSELPKLSSEELDKLVAPIALYPDSLIALVLPASTESADVVLAARYIASGSDQDAIDNQSWSDSVKSLARFPDLVKWMDENLAWTQQMGEVFEAQPADVMNAIQRMRAQARAAGLLTDTPQQKVVMQDEVICIVPAEPEVIYVPRYDPEILWMRRPYYGSFMTFGLGFGIGSWLYFDCDWFGHGIWMHDRQPGWVYHPAWRRPTGEIHRMAGTPWHSDFRRGHYGRLEHPPMSVAVRPSIMTDPHRDRNGRPENPWRPESRGHFDNAGRSDHRGDSTERSERSAPPSVIGNRANQSVSPSHPVRPPSGSAATSPSSNRPKYRPDGGAQGQTPREGPRAGHSPGDSPSVNMPRPPSHNPPSAPLPQPTPAPSMRPSRNEQSGGAAPTVTPPAARSAPAAQSSGQEKKEGDEQHQTRGRGQGFQRQ